MDVARKGFEPGPRFRARDARLQIANISAVSEQREPLPSAKVRSGDRRGVDGWLKFHAAYSRSFAVEALRRLLPPEGGLVVDPFCGSGTTVRAALDVGARVRSFDLNPALVALANASILPASSARPVLQLLESRAPTAQDAVGELTSQWLHDETAASLSNWRAAIAALPDLQARQFGAGLLVRAARDIIRPASGTNPTWPKPPQRRRKRDVRAILLATASRMLRDLEREGRGARSPVAIKLANACAIPLPDKSASAVLTSPPYLSRIDYVRATLPELLALGYSEVGTIEKLRSDIMGGVLTTRRSENEPRGWGPLTLSVLRDIETHDSKASKSYYRTLARQYFFDLDASLAEILRILRPGARAMIVVQTSYYKNVHVPLPDIVREIAERHSGRASVAQQEAVTQHFGHLSPHQRMYVQRKTLHEAVVDIMR